MFEVARKILSGDKTPHDHFKNIHPDYKQLFLSIPLTLNLEIRPAIASLMATLGTHTGSACYNNPHTPKLIIDHTDMSKMIFDLTQCDKTTVKFQAFGCQGSAAGAFSAFRKSFLGNSQDQEMVARAMADDTAVPVYGAARPAAVASASLTTDFRIALGDNFYDDGVNSVGSKKFAETFYSFYQGLTLVALGNHDWTAHGNRTKTRTDSNWSKPIECAYNQVFQTYHLKADTREHQTACNTSGDWQMPFRYYMVRHPLFNIYVIDSSAIAFDVVQQEWLVETIVTESARNPEKFNILISHHPLLYYGKRRVEAWELRRYQSTIHEGVGFHNDAVIYVRGGNTILIREGDARFSNMGKILQNILHHNNLEQIDAVIAAHEHFLCSASLHLKFANGNCKWVDQYTSGGGGAEPGNIKFTDVSGGVVLQDTRSIPAYEAAEYAEDAATAKIKISRDARSDILLDAKTHFQQSQLGFFNFIVSKDQIAVSPEIVFNDLISESEKAALKANVASWRNYSLKKTYPKPQIASV